MTDENKFEANAVFGLLRTIANGIYPTSLTKIREAVANSQDNNANNFYFNIDETSNSISLLDDGSGFTLVKLSEAINNIGLGLSKDSKDKNSFFGLGFFSVLSLGGSVNIFSKSGSTYYHFEIDSKEIFSKSNEELKISSLDKFIINKPYDAGEHKKSSVFYNEYIDFFTSTESFTEILISNVSTSNIKRMLDEDFVEELRKYLPLSILENEPFFDKIVDEKQKKQILELQKSDYSKTINFYFNDINNQNGKTKLYKYFPRFKEDTFFQKEFVQIIISTEYNYSMYFCYDFSEIQNKGYTDSGIWVRNKNYLVQASSNLQKPKTKTKLFDEPIKKWVYGEIFHNNMHELLNANRDGFNWESEEFINFFKNVKKHLDGINEKIRKVHGLKISTFNIHVSPFECINDPKQSPLRLLPNRLKNLNDINDAYDTGDVFFDKISRTFEEGIDYENERIDVRYKNLEKDELLFKTKNKEIYLTNSQEEYHDFWDNNNDKLLAYIPQSLYEERKYKLFNKEISLTFIASEKCVNPVAFDKSKNRFYINLSNSILQADTISNLDLILAVEIAWSMSKNKDLMKFNIYKILKIDDPKEQINYDIKDSLKRLK